MQLTELKRWGPPFYLLTAYIAFVLVRPHEYELSSLAQLPILSVLLVAGCIAWLISGEREFEAPQIYLAPILLVVMSFTMALSGWVGGAVVVFRGHLSIIGLFLLIAFTVDSPARMRVIFKVIAIAATVMAWHGILQVDAGIGWSGAKLLGGRITYVGIFNDPNDLGLMFITSLPIILFLLHEARFILWRIAILISFASIMYGIYLTNSRGTVVGLMATLGAYFWIRFGKLRTILLAAITVPPAILLAPSRFRDMGGDGIDESALYRFEVWYAGLMAFKAEPFFGVGATRFGDVFFMAAHNSFIQVLAELGFIGAYVWTAFLTLSIYMMYRINTTGPSRAILSSAESAAAFDSQRRVAGALMYSLLAFCAAALFLSRAYNITLFILCGLAVAQYHLVRRQWPDEIEQITFRDNRVKIFWFWLITVAVSYLGMKVGLAMK